MNDSNVYDAVSNGISNQLGIESRKIKHNKFLWITNSHKILVMFFDDYIHIGGRIASLTPGGRKIEKYYLGDPKLYYKIKRLLFWIYEDEDDDNDT